MMTSVGSSRARGSWEQTQNQTQSQTAHKPRPQATAEQIRLAQMISDHNDADFEEKVKQLIDITGKDQDESMIALHDCNGDVNRAINVLLEGSPDTDSWEMVGKKKGVSGPKESGQTEANEEGKENRERGSERDGARRRGGPAPGQGFQPGTEFRGQENGLDGGKAGGVSGRGTERGRRGRGRGRGGAGRRGGRFSAQGMGQIDKGARYDCTGEERTFNPADYAEPAQAEENYGGGGTWSNTGNLEPEDGTRLEFSGVEGTNYPRKFDSAPGAWRTATEEWGTEDWNEDLTETKIFTASSVASMPLPQENVTITAGQRIDLAVLLGKTPPSSTPYAQHSMASMLSKSFAEVGDPKGGSGGTTSGSQFLEQFKTAQALAQLAAQHSQPGPQNPAASASSSWDTSPLPGAVRFEVPARPRPPPSAPISPLSKPPAPSRPSPSPSPRPVPGQQVSPGSSDLQSSSPQPLQQHKLKPQKKRTSITTKIPALAVEMPGSADITGLNLQFGALQFGSEPVLPEYDSTPATSAPGNQVQNSLYTSASSESAPSIPNPSQDQAGPRRRGATPSVSSSPQKDMQPSKNGFGSMQTTQSVEAAAGSAVPWPVSDPTAPASASGMASLTDGAAGPASLMTVSNQTPLGSLGHAEDLPPNSVTQPQHNALSTQPNSLAPSSTVRTSNSTLLHSGVDGDPACTPSPRPPRPWPLPRSPPPPRCRRRPPSAARPLGHHGDGAGRPGPGQRPGHRAQQRRLHGPPASSAAASSAAPPLLLHLLVTRLGASSRESTPKPASWSAPLLPNPYIMAPGLLHAYPPQVYGYDDLQMLQTRIPLDYYSIPFATPTTALTGREGSLTSNPYSAGDLSKFGRGDASSPAPSTTLAQPQQSQSQTHHTAQQPFLNPASRPATATPACPTTRACLACPAPSSTGPVFP
ncbi:hypothetical protein ANANG_G00181390 [Anguilla anguilla]|uniref:UBA domain-containing protein n=1 Tax=Anguilla anguilla TaxID=7936 RepID=A0A9D3M717_ANGAN|nr:hypothetical protein ANANG_G00181390 [Anguilla anguilla]